MNPAHLALLKQGVGVWNSQRPWIECLSGQELETSYQQYLKALWEMNGKWLDNDSLDPRSLEDYQEALQEDAADLAGADLRGMDLRGYDLSYCNLRGAYLIGADLRRAYLKKAHLDGASLSGALVEQASLDAAGVHIPDYQKQTLTGPFTGCPTLSLDEWAEIVQFYQKRCAYCGGPYEVIDHILPRSSGGTTWRGNVVPACFVCANARRDLRQTGKKVIPAEVMERIAAEIKRRAQSNQE